MRPNDPGLENATIFSTEQLLGKLKGHFAVATEIPDDLQTTLLRLKSGYRDNENPFAAAHEDDPNGDEQVEKRRQRMIQRMSSFAKFQTFSHNGFDLNYNQFMDSIEGVIDDVDDEIETTEQKAEATAQEAAAMTEEVTVSDEDILRAPNGQIIDDEFELQRVMRQLGPDAELKGTLMTSETTVIDDVRVETANIDEAAKVLEEAAELEEQAAQLEEQAAQLEVQATELDVYRAKIASGEMSPDDLPEEYKDLIIAEHIESEQTLSTEPAAVEVAEQPPILEQAQQFVVSVAPTVKPEFTP